MRKKSGLRRPFSSMPACSAMQATGHTAEQRWQATQRSSPSGSRVSTIRPRQRGGRRRFFSG